MRQYRDGDTYGRPTGEVITEENLYTEAVLMASVIVNRANRSGQSLQDVVSARGQFLGYSRGMNILNSGNFGVNGSAECERLRTAVRAVSEVLQNGVVNDSIFNWWGVMQERLVRKGGRMIIQRFIRRQGNAIRAAYTDFF